MLQDIMRFFFLCWLLAPLSLSANPLSTNVPIQHTENFKEYYTSGKYFKEIEKKLADAQEYLDRQLQHPRPNRLAIVLDIDETALSNYQDLERLAFTYDPQALMGAHMLAGAQPIPPILALYQHAIKNNVAVFFISERPNTPEVMAATFKNLKNSGYEQWEELILRPIDKNKQSIQAFKTATRQRIAAQGFDVILNIGDQEADLNLGYAEVRVKLPNPFYTIG